MITIPKGDFYTDFNEMKLIFRPIYTGCTKGESAAKDSDFWTCKQISVGGVAI